MICLDSSVVVKVIAQEEFSDKAEALITSAMAAGTRLIGPPLLPIEVTNVIRQRERRTPSLTAPEARAQLYRYEALPLQIRNPLGIHRHALQLAERYGLAAAYDAHYLALAEILRCPFWTDDRKLLRQVGNAADCRWFGDFEPSPV